MSHAQTNEITKKVTNIEMILPIYLYGQPVLRRVADVVTPEYEGLS